MLFGIKSALIHYKAMCAFVDEQGYPMYGHFVSIHQALARDASPPLHPFPAELTVNIEGL